MISSRLVLRSQSRMCRLCGGFFQVENWLQVERTEKVRGYFCHSLIAIDISQHSAFLVEAGQSRNLLVINSQPLAHCRGQVVRARGECAAIDIADAVP